MIAEEMNLINQRSPRLLLHAGLAVLTSFLSFAAISARAQEVDVPTSGGFGDGSSTIPRWRLPVRVTVGLNTGYDENVDNTPNGDGSVFTGVSLGLAYEFGTTRTRVSLSTSTGVTYYPETGRNEYDPSLNLTATVSYQVSLRLTVNAAVSVHYLAEPDFSSNLSVDRRAGNYFSSQDSISAGYQWLPRFSTVTGYSLSTVLYDEGDVAFSQNRVDNSFSESFHFLFLPVTSIVADYSISLSTYDGGDRDSHTQSFLLGLDHTFSEKLQGSVRGGLEVRSTDNPVFQANDGANPHFEANLSYVFSGKTNLSWNAFYGTQESYLADSSASVTFRTGLSVSYAVTPRIAATLGGNYQHNENGGTEIFSGVRTDSTEDSIDLSLGLTYSINRFLSATAGYSHTEVESDFGIRSYSRNRYSGGLSVNF